MRKPLMITFFALILCAVAAYASLYIPAYFQEKHFHEARKDGAAESLKPEKELRSKLTARLLHKADELDRRKIVGKERQRLLELEVNAVTAESNRVRASNFTVPFNETPLPIDHK